MALSDVISRRYAQALFAVAVDGDAVAAQADSLERAASLLGDPEAAAVLRNPRIASAARQRFALAVLERVTPEVRNLVRLLMERGRVAALPGILEAYRARADRAAGVVRAEVVTAIAVGSDLERRIVGLLRERLGNEVETTVRQDPEILGGLVIRIGERVIDGSVRTRLAQLQAALA